ncbi:hypothetical protein FJW06_14920 [Mesorhizobium sp. B4-1-3]|nr:hypothetical protein FJW06_14920 [Mesorhizobium sp. B4-1-3]
MRENACERDGRLVRGKAETGFTHLEELAAAKSLSERFELQTAFFHKQIGKIRRAGQEASRPR